MEECEVKIYKVTNGVEDGVDKNKANMDSIKRIVTNYVTQLCEKNGLVDIKVSIIKDSSAPDLYQFCASGYSVAFLTFAACTGNFTVTPDNDINLSSTEMFALKAPASCKVAKSLCKTCKNAHNKDGCKCRTYIDYDGKEYYAKNHREDTPCSGCGVAKYQYHHHGCPQEICPKCGEQLKTCECEFRIKPIKED